MKNNKDIIRQKIYQYRNNFYYALTRKLNYDSVVQVRFVLNPDEMSPLTSMSFFQIEINIIKKINKKYLETKKTTAIFEK